MKLNLNVLVALVFTSIAWQLINASVKDLDLQGYRPKIPQRPPEESRTVLIPNGTVTVEGGRAALRASDGRVFNIDAIPAGEYRDIQIVNRELRSYTRVPARQSPEQCELLSRLTVVPPQLKSPDCNP